MISRLFSGYITAIFVCGSMFAADSASAKGLVEIAMPDTMYHVEGKVNPFKQGWAYAIKGTDGKQIGYAGRLIRLANGALIPEFKFAILDADSGCSPKELCTKPSCTSYKTRLMGVCCDFKSHESGPNIFVGLAQVTSRWQLISAAQSGHQHAELESMVLPKFPARTAAKLLKKNGITCVLIDVEAYKQSGREQLVGHESSKADELCFAEIKDL